MLADVRAKRGPSCAENAASGSGLAKGGHVFQRDPVIANVAQWLANASGRDRVTGAPSGAVSPPDGG